MHPLSATAQLIVDEVKASLHRDINFMDEAGVIIASTNPARLGMHHAGAARILQERLEELVIPAPTQDGMQAGINLPIRMGGQNIGVIGITGDPEEVSVFGEVIQKMTEIMLKYIQSKEEMSVMDDARLQFIEHWLFAEKINAEELRIRAAFFGLDISAPWIVSLLNIQPKKTAGHPASNAADNPELNYSQYLRSIRSVLENESQSYCFSYGSRMVVLLQTNSVKKAAATLSRIRLELISRFPVAVSGGISSSTKDPLDIRRCFQEANTAAIAAAESQADRMIFYDETSLEFIARSLDPVIGQSIMDIVFFQCRPEESAEFIETIQLYFAEKGNLDRMSERLYVHRNTIQYRIQKIQKRTGYDLRTPRDACILYFAAMFYKRFRM